MAMTNATTDSGDWPEFFHHDAFVSHPTYPPHPFLPTSVSADSLVVTTLPTGSPAVSAASSGGGRSEKGPPRKRSRSSRRAPTTLLNTDAANFRAMVQRFTGASTGPIAAAYGSGRPSDAAFLYGAHNAVRQPEEYRYGAPQQQEGMMRFSADGRGGDGDDEEIMPAFFFDGMAGGGQLATPGQMGREDSEYF